MLDTVIIWVSRILVALALAMFAVALILLVLFVLNALIFHMPFGTR